MKNILLKISLNRMSLKDYKMKSFYKKLNILRNLIKNIKNKLKN